jgi:DNA-3-methyladenine glycosylase
MRLNEALESDDPCLAARALLGWKLTDGVRSARIVETEAYGGEDDAGSHAWRGPTPRTKIMYGPPGAAFVYFTYGRHWMLNCVCRPTGSAGAVLIRACEPLEGLDEMRRNRPGAKAIRDLLSGPGRLAAAFGIDGSLNGRELLCEESLLRLRPDLSVTEALCGRRVGLSAGRGESLARRFIDPSRREWASPAPLRPS